MYRIYKTKIKNLFFFNLEDFIFYKYIWKMYILAGLKIKNGENQDLFRNKDDFWIFLSTNKS